MYGPLGDPPAQADRPRRQTAHVCRPPAPNGGPCWRPPSRTQWADAACGPRFPRPRPFTRYQDTAMKNGLARGTAAPPPLLPPLVLGRSLSPAVRGRTVPRGDAHVDSSTVAEGNGGAGRGARAWDGGGRGDDCGARGARARRGPRRAGWAQRSHARPCGAHTGRRGVHGRLPSWQDDVAAPPTSSAGLVGTAGRPPPAASHSRETAAGGASLIPPHPALWACPPTPSSAQSHPP